jgi:hypothetical protein
MAGLSDVPRWLTINPQSKYLVSVIDYRTGQTCFIFLADDMRGVIQAITPIFQRLGYPVPSLATVYQMRAGNCYRKKNGYCLSDVLKIQDLSRLMSVSKPVDVSGPTPLDSIKEEPPGSMVTLTLRSASQA